MKEFLLTWIREWDIADDLIYKKAVESQAIFIRSMRDGLLDHTPVFVVSCHMSKSVLLPVYYIKMQNGVEVLIRNNFYDWKMSVKIPAHYKPLPDNYLPLDCLHYGVGDEKHTIAEYCLEGFPSEWAFRAYNPGNPGKQFTVEISDNFKLYVILHALKHAYPNVMFDVNEDKRTLEEIQKSIEKIYAEYGFSKTSGDIFDGEGKKIFQPRKIISEREILCRTYNALRHTEEEANGGQYVADLIDVPENPEEFAKRICKFPSVHEVFLSEEYTFN